MLDGALIVRILRPRFRCCPGPNVMVLAAGSTHDLGRNRGLLAGHPAPLPVFVIADFLARQGFARAGHRDRDRLGVSTSTLSPS
jgi:hypothetical protein